MVTAYLVTSHDWLESRKVNLSAEKSSAIVFTTWSKETNFVPHLTINNSPIPLKSKVKILGVTFDSMLSFRKHLRSNKEQLKKRKNILFWKRLLVATWAAQKTLWLKSNRSERPELRCSHLGFHNQQYKLEPPANATKRCSSHNFWLCKNVRHQWLTGWGWNAAR